MCVAHCRRVNSILFFYFSESESRISSDPDGSFLSGYQKGLTIKTSDPILTPPGPVSELRQRTGGHLILTLPQNHGSGCLTASPVRYLVNRQSSCRQTMSKVINHQKK